MSEFKLTVPVIFCVFKRLDTTKQVFAKIREAEPQKLYVVSDAPREGVLGESEKVEEVRAYIDEHVDWNCELIHHYAEKNMGCGRRISSGISWVFEREERAIILEDDCVPDITFFRYCQEMLEYYENDERILLISGNNPIEQLYHTEHDYLFSHVPFVWGWATWRRVWKLYDYNMDSWPQNKKNTLIKKAIPVKRAYYYYVSEFDALSGENNKHTWDYQFMYTGIINSMYGILPAKSLVRNIGFIEESTHTKKAPEWIHHGVSSFSFPIKHRETVEWDKGFDVCYMKHAWKHGYIIWVKHMLGLDINKSVFELLKKKRTG